MSIVRRIGFISDMHVGCRYAIWPEYLETEEGNVVKQSAGQKQLLKSFGKFKEELDRNKVDTIIECGDAIEGKQMKDFGANLMIPELEYQKTA